MDDFWNNNDDEPDWFEKDDDNDGVGNDNGGGDDDDDGENQSSSGTHHIMILIDCDPIMFTKTTTTTSTYMNDCLKAIQTVIRNKIRTVTIYKAGKRDGIGLLFYNTKFRIAATTDMTMNTPSNTSKSAEKDKDDDDNDNLDENDEEEEDDDDDVMMFGSSLQSVTTNVHEFLPLEPPGVSTMERVQRSLVSSTTSTVIAIDIEKEYGHDTAENDTNDDDMDNNDAASKSHLPPLLYALRKALLLYSNASCVKKTKKSSAGKWEEPDSKHIWIITPHDDPCHSITKINNDDNRTEMMRLLQSCIKDIQENDIQLHVWPILIPPLSSSDATSTVFPKQASFDRSIFYDSITTTLSNNSSILTAEDWVNTLDAVYKKTRPAYRVPFLLPNWKQQSSVHHALYLDMYNVHQLQKEPSAVYIHQSTGKVLGKVRQLITVDDGGGHVIVEQRNFDSTSNKGQANQQQRRRRLQTFFEFGNEYVPFSLRDKVLIKKKCNTNPEFASLILLGFKPATSIPFYHTIEKSYFAYPSTYSTATSNSDSRNNGRGTNSNNSIDAIAHLHASMIRQNVIGIGELLTRATATSRLVVIRPIQEILRPVTGNHDKNDCSTEEVEDEVYMLVRPPGLLITALPFEDEMRSAPPSTYNAPDDTSEEMIRAAMNLIEQQTFGDDIEIGVDFTNAAMSRFWNYIEHIAFNDALVVEVEQQYDTEVDVEKVLERSSMQIEQFASLLPESIQLEKVSASGQKRKTTTKATERSTNDKSSLDWSIIVKEGTLSKCTVADLKLKLRTVGEPVIGNKAVLVERLGKYFATLESTDRPIKQEADVTVKPEDNII